MILGSLGAIGLQLAAFPFPSPLVKPALSPKDRWPTELVQQWVEAGTPDKSFSEFFARDPERTVPPGLDMVSPADGVIKNIVTVGDTTYFVVGLSYWDVHVVRTPVAGKVMALEQEGLNFSKFWSETNDEPYLQGKSGPVQTILTIDTPTGDQLKLRLITSYWASRIKTWVRVDHEVSKGDRVGRILLGSSVVVDIPQGYRYLVKKGERVVAGETPIATRQD